MLHNEHVLQKSASIQPRASPDKFAVGFGLASRGLGSFPSQVTLESIAEREFVKADTDVSGLVSYQESALSGRATKFLQI